MGNKPATWNDIPFDEHADAKTKADEFDRQYAENKAEGERKEREGEWRG